MINQMQTMIDFLRLQHEQMFVILQRDRCDVQMYVLTLREKTRCIYIYILLILLLFTSVIYISFPKSNTIFTSGCTGGLRAYFEPPGAVGTTQSEQGGQITIIFIIIIRSAAKVNQSTYMNCQEQRHVMSNQNKLYSTHWSSLLAV